MPRFDLPRRDKDRLAWALGGATLLSLLGFLTAAHAVVTSPLAVVALSLLFLIRIASMR